MRTNTHTHTYTVKRAKKRARARRCTLLLITIVITIMTTSHIESHYTREAMVQSMEDNTVVFVDNMGYTWEATDVENITEGQMVELKMFTNHTNDIIYDDIIKSIEPTAIRMK